MTVLEIREINNESQNGGRISTLPPLARETSPAKKTLTARDIRKL